MAHRRQTYDYQPFAAVSRLVSPLLSCPVSIGPAAGKALKGVSRLVSWIETGGQHSVGASSVAIPSHTSSGLYNIRDFLHSKLAGHFACVSSCTDPGYMPSAGRPAVDQQQSAARNRYIASPMTTSNLTSEVIIAQEGIKR